MYRSKWERFNLKNGNKMQQTGNQTPQVDFIDPSLLPAPTST
jgi:hypothetical protein